MPIYEAMCENPDCSLHGAVVEHFYSRPDLDMEPCRECGGETRKLVSRFAVTFVGDFSTRYNDKKAENPHLTNQWVWEKKTPDGKPRQRLLTNWQERKAWMKQEGLRDDIGNIDAHPDGKPGLNAGCGMPGAWC